MEKGKQKVKSPKSVGLDVLAQKPEKKLIVASYKPIPMFRSVCRGC